jgi:hypothetical protein
VVAFSGALAAAAACLPDPDNVVGVDAALVVPDAALASLGPYCGDGVIETLDDGGDAGESCDPGDAGFPGCDHCQWSCPEGVIDDAGGHCYFYAGVSTTLEEAANACRKHAHVVTLASAREAALVSVLTDGGPYWVGISVDGYTLDYLPEERTDDPGYPGNPGETCTGCFGGANRGVLAPLDGSASGNCVASVDGGWFKVPCSDGGVEFSTVCEREPPGERATYCLGPFCTTLPATAGAKRYVIGLTEVSAEQAVNACAGYRNGGLVTLSTPEEREELARELELLVPPEDAVGGLVTAWIGLHLEDGGWTWDDGVPASSEAGRPLPWGENQPASAGAGRAFLRLSQRFPGNFAFDTKLVANDDGDGAGARFFICQRSPPLPDGG